MKLSFTFFLLCGSLQNSFACPSSKNKETTTAITASTVTTKINTTTTASITTLTGKAFEGYIYLTRQNSSALLSKSPVKILEKF